MTIKQALEKEQGIRLSFGDRWMVCSEGVFSVYSREYGQKKTRTIITTESDIDAFLALIEE